MSYMRKIFKKLFRFIADLASLAVLGLLVVMMLSQHEIGPWRFVVVQSGSMEPTIMTGDLAIIEVSKLPDRATKGDVILFEDARGRVTLHRIVGKSEQGFVTKGDNNESPDPDPIGEVNGVYLARVPWMGYALFYLQEGVEVLTGPFN
jgi:signal peptidase